MDRKTLCAEGSYSQRSIVRNGARAETPGVNDGARSGSNVKVKRMKNEMHLTDTTTVCCVCGGHISGPWPMVGKNLSHGYCQKHYQIAMREVQAYLALLERQYGLAPRAMAA